MTDKQTETTILGSSVEAAQAAALEAAIRGGQTGLINYHMRLLMEAGIPAFAAEELSQAAGGQSGRQTASDTVSALAGPHSRSSRH